MTAATATLARRTRSSGTSHVAALVVLATGAIVLLARPFVGGSVGTRIALFAASYVAIGSAAVTVADGRAPSRGATEPGATSRPSAPGDGAIPVGATLVVGLAAIALAPIVAGPPVPSPWVAATLPLSILAAVAEEALFRRVAFAQLQRIGGPAIAVVGSAALFALVHLPAYGTTALPVDLGAGLLFGWQRWASGTWTVPATTHAAANLLVVLR